MDIWNSSECALGNHKQLKPQGPQGKEQNERKVSSLVLKFLLVYPTHVTEGEERVLCPSKGVPSSEVFQCFDHPEYFLALLLMHTEEELNFALQCTSKAAC